MTNFKDFLMLLGILMILTGQVIYGEEIGNRAIQFFPGGLIVTPLYANVTSNAFTLTTSSESISITPGVKYAGITAQAISSNSRSTSTVTSYLTIIPIPAVSDTTDTDLATVSTSTSTSDDYTMPDTVSENPSGLYLSASESINSSEDVHSTMSSPQEPSIPSSSTTLRLTTSTITLATTTIVTIELNPSYSDLHEVSTSTETSSIDIVGSSVEQQVATTLQISSEISQACICTPSTVFVTGIVFVTVTAGTQTEDSTTKTSVRESPFIAYPTSVSYYYSDSPIIGYQSLSLSGVESSSSSTFTYSPIVGYQLAPTASTSLSFYTAASYTSQAPTDAAPYGNTTMAVSATNYNLNNLSAMTATLGAFSPTITPVIQFGGAVESAQPSFLLLGGTVVFLAAIFV